MDLITYLAGDVTKAHPGVSVKSTVLLLKKKRPGKEKKKKDVCYCLSVGIRRCAVHCGQSEGRPSGPAWG